MKSTDHLIWQMRETGKDIESLPKNSTLRVKLEQDLQRMNDELQRRRAENLKK